MSALDKFNRALEVLQAGKSLENPEVWKNRQLLMTPILVILGAIPYFFPNIPLVAGDQNIIALSLAILGTLVNGYLTVGTTDKIGLPPKKDG